MNDVQSVTEVTQESKGSVKINLFSKMKGKWRSIAVKNRRIILSIGFILLFAIPLAIISIQSNKSQEIIEADASVSTYDSEGLLLER